MKYIEEFNFMKINIPKCSLEFFNPETNKVLEREIYDYLYKHVFTILFFYPADFSAICPTELQALQKLEKEFKKEKAGILVISRDSILSHKEWIEQETKLDNFPHLMATDRDGIILDSLGLLKKKGDFSRTTIIVDTSGSILSLEIMPYPIGRNIDELLRKIRSLHHVYENPEALCPEHWEDSSDSISDGIKKEKKNAPRDPYQ